MLPAGNLMYGKMTCWPEEQPAATPDARFPSTSFFQTEPTPAATSRPRDANNTQRKESSGGNDQESNLSYLRKNKCFSVEVKKKRRIPQVWGLQPLICLLPSHSIPQSPSDHSRTNQTNWISSETPQNGDLGTWKPGWKTETGRGLGGFGAEEAGEVEESRN